MEVDTSAPNFPYYSFLDNNHDYDDDHDDYNDDHSVEDGDLAGPVSEDPLDTTKTGFASVGRSFPTDKADITNTRLIQLLYDIGAPLSAFPKFLTLAAKANTCGHQFTNQFPCYNTVIWLLTSRLGLEQWSIGWSQWLFHGVGKFTFLCLTSELWSYPSLSTPEFALTCWSTGMTLTPFHHLMLSSLMRSTLPTGIMKLTRYVLLVPIKFSWGSSSSLTEHTLPIKITLAVSVSPSPFPSSPNPSAIVIMHGIPLAWSPSSSLPRPKATMLMHTTMCWG